jgi:hypothetical protein
MSDNKSLMVTTIKIANSLYNEFKILNIQNKFTLRELVINSMHLYNEDEQFRHRIINFNTPTADLNALTVPLNFISGSNNWPEFKFNRVEELENETNGASEVTE